MIADGNKVKPCRVCGWDEIGLWTNQVGKSCYGIILCGKCGTKYECVSVDHTAVINILVSMWNDGVGVPENSSHIYDEEIIHPNCTVQILRNSITGAESVGWWENE